MTNYPGLVSESCHESTFKLIRPQGLVTILSSSLLICNFNAILHRICILNHVYMSIRAEFIRVIWLVGYGVIVMWLLVSFGHGLYKESSQCSSNNVANVTMKCPFHPSTFYACSCAKMNCKSNFLWFWSGVEHQI